jgi:hypothetical protein
VSFRASGLEITATGAVADPPAEDVTIIWAGGTVTPGTFKLPATRFPKPRAVSVGDVAVSLEEAWMVRVEVTGLNSAKVIFTRSVRPLVTDLVVPLIVTVIELGKAAGLKI